MLHFPVFGPAVIDPRHPPFHFDIFFQVLYLHILINQMTLSDLVALHPLPQHLAAVVTLGR
jgi:hypothetical protein